MKTNIIIAAPENHPLNYRKEIIIKNSHWINKKPKLTQPVDFGFWEIDNFCDKIKKAEKFPPYLIIYVLA